MAHAIVKLFSNYFVLKTSSRKRDTRMLVHINVLISTNEWITELESFCVKLNIENRFGPIGIININRITVLFFHFLKRNVRNNIDTKRCNVEHVRMFHSHTFR